MDTKAPWFSKGIMGGVLVIATVVVGWFGVEVSDEEKTLVLTQGDALIASATALLGAFFGIWGRLTAKKKIGLSGPPPKSKLPLILVGVVALSSTACANQSHDPIVHYTQTQEVYISTVQSLIDAKTFGRIEQSDWDNVFLPIINEGNRILDDLKIAAEAGDQPSIDLILVRVKPLLRRLLLEQAKLERISFHEPSRYRFADLNDPGGVRSFDPKLQLTHREALPRLHRQARRAA